MNKLLTLVFCLTSIAVCARAQDITGLEKIGPVDHQIAQEIREDLVRRRRFRRRAARPVQA